MKNNDIEKAADEEKFPLCLIAPLKLNRENRFLWKAEVK